MDKKRLNNEIVLCRPAVRKARVAVIRKMLKKMKILRACKLEAVKEKKFKKSERLLEKVQIMKKIKDDEVTKFALRTKDIENFLKDPKLSLRQNALACLAKHEAVVKKITSIKEQIPNWEVELPLLLDSLGKKKNNIKKNLKELKTNNNSFLNKSKGNQMKRKIKESEDILGKISSEKKEVKITKSIPKKFTVVSDYTEEQNKEQGKSKSLTDLTCENSGKIEKIDDPFFIEKKVVPSKLLSDDFSSQKNSYEVERLENFKKKEKKNFFKSEKNSDKSKVQKLFTKPEKEELHPSWAAKKVKLIKPFQGIKIKFSDN